MVPADEARALSRELAATHDRLRDRLDALRETVAAGNDPGAHMTDDLREHCLGVCVAIDRHHTGEDSGMLPALRAADPRLGPTVDRLIEDHQAVAGLLTRVRDLISEPDPSRLLGELDGLAAILTSHFAYEERSISEALDALDLASTTGWQRAVLRPGD